MIYVVTSGEYSDFRIHSVWSTKEKAEAHIKAANKYEWVLNDNIGEYELDEKTQPVHMIKVKMLEDGTVIQLGRYINEQVGFQWFMTFNRGLTLSWCVATESEERAIKVVNEKRAQILAQNLWNNEKGVRELFKK